MRDDAAMVLWTALRPGYMVALFTVGWAANVWAFSRFRIDYVTVLGLGKEECINPRQICCIGFGLLTCLLVLLVSADIHEELLLWFLCGALLLYVALLGCLFTWLPIRLARRVRWRQPLARALWRSVVPASSKEVPFVEVLVADGLTSMAKVFFDLVVSSCVAVNWISFSTWTAIAGDSPTTATSVSVPPNVASRAPWSPASKLWTEANPPKFRLGEVYEECSRSSMPFLFWLAPFLIRAYQCVVSAQNAPDVVASNLHRVNLAKYMSIVPVVLFAFLYMRWSQTIEGVFVGAEDIEVLWAMASILNAVFSFMWDMVMDWGLMQPSLHPHSVDWSVGLRPILLFRSVFGFYHFAIVTNLFGRTLWSLRWSPQATELLGSFFLATIQQTAEVCRRCLWNVLRVEWECIKRGVHRIDKHFPV